VYLTQWGSFGTGDGQFDSPRGVATDATGNVYVADYNNHRIQKFTSAGTYVTQWGSRGSGNGQFTYPHGVATDALYVVNYDGTQTAWI
jgi:DNA-binding beta-propeller fold protein YncE